MQLHITAIYPTLAALLIGLCVLGSAPSLAQAVDPGVRQAPADNGPPPPLAGLTADELAFFQDGLARFSSVKVVVSATGDNSGLGPRFNSNQCSSCHLQPFIGGTSPPVNPLLAVASADGATNTVPWFLTQNGPIREARFVASNGVPDGGVHNVFVITNRSDAGSCNRAQPDFAPAGNGLTGQGGNRHPNAHLGGNTNRSANDGTITRFGWKAQNKSLLLFAGEAYNVEMGISNQLFPQERDETPSCQGGIGKHRGGYRRRRIGH